MNKKLFLAVIPFFVFVQFSCISFKPAKSKGSLSHYQTYFVNDSVVQYFIKPLKFKAENNNELLVDFTFRHSSNTDISVTMNFSLLSDSDAGVLEELDVVMDSDSFEIYKPKLFFREKKKNNFHYRYSSTINLKQFVKFFGANKQTFNIRADRFVPSAKSSKVIQIINNDLVDFQLKK